MKHTLLRTSLTAGSTSLAVATLALLVAGCGEKDLAKSPVRDIPGVVILDTGDDGDNMPLEDTEAPAGFNSYGFWYTYHDVGTCEKNDTLVVDEGGFVNPAQGSTFSTTPYASVAGLMPPPEMLANAPDNTNGIRFSGGKHTYFGAGLGFKFANAYGTEDISSRDGVLNPGINISGAGYKGVRFWAYSPFTQDWDVKVQDQYSTPQAGLCVPRGAAPGCVGDQNCEDAPILSVKVGPEWRLYEIYFTDMADDAATPELEAGPLKREAWSDVGADAPGVSPEKIYQLQFQTADGTVDFDLWLDNVGFLL